MKSFEKFPADFVWGTATASYQVEGANDEESYNYYREYILESRSV